ncbi:hypothetical protein XANCAGTX0491_003861 [Xanthoria calcicola]
MALLTSGINSGQLSEVIAAYTALHNSSLQRSDLPHFHVRDAGNKGLGCFAARQILPGTLVHQEAPLFIVYEIGDGELSRANREEISVKVDRLSDEDRAAYMQLVVPPQIRILRTKNPVQVFNANSFETVAHTERRTTDQGIFLRAARFNHSCVPNAYFQYNPRIGQLTIFAISCIHKDDEILVNYKYEDIYKSRDERRQNLQRGYQFTCECLACHDGPYHDESEHLRSLMGVLDTQDQQGLGDSTEQRLRKHRLISLLGTAGWPYPQQAHLYEQLAEDYLGEMNRLGAGYSGNITECRQKAQAAARGKLMVEILAIGPNTEEVDKSLALIAEAGYHGRSG